MIPSTSTKRTRVDMHCHSTASEVAKLGIQRSVGLPECATPPQEVYEIAKARGMDFVTITDHDTIAGCLEIADRADVFISEELTTWFKDEAQAVHILCYGITPEDHEFLQAHARDLEVCAAYLDERGLTSALAHPFFAVAAPLESRHRRRLAELFGVWEIRNGSRARELNMPAATYIETHGGIGIGGSDDHAGVDIGRTYTETPPASSPEEFLRHIRNGQADACGSQGSAAKWAHAAIAIAIRSLESKELVSSDGGVDPAVVLEIAERVVADGGERGGKARAHLGSPEAAAFLHAWLESVELPADPAALLAIFKSDGFSHSEHHRRVKRIHERKLTQAVDAAVGAAAGRQGYGDAARALFDAVLPVMPYAPAISILGSEKAKLARRDGEPGRVAVLVDGIGSMHGVSHTVERIREYGVPGYEVEVIGTDSRVDRRLPAVCEIDIPFYEGIKIGVPRVPELVETVAEGRYDLIHLTAPGPVGIAAALAARIGGLPLIGSYHTELSAYAGLRSADPAVEAGMRAAVSLFYGQCQTVLSPSPASDDSLLGMGIEADRIARWVRGVDLDLYDPLNADPGAYPGEIKVLYAGRLTKEKGIDLLADAFLKARERDSRLHLLLAGGGPEEEALRARLGDAATFLGWLGREELAVLYASADIFLFCSPTDTYGQVITEAQASGLPVVAVAAGGPVSLIRDRQTGWLVPDEAGAIASAVTQLAASPFIRARLSRAAQRQVRGRTWEAAFEQLASGYDRVLGLPEPSLSLSPQGPWAEGETRGIRAA